MSASASSIWRWMSLRCTQGKIERWHQTLKNRILLENYYLPGDLEEQIKAFVADYNHHRYHESIDNLTPADVYVGRGQTILLQREKDQTPDHRTTPLAAPTASRLTSSTNEPEPPLVCTAQCLKISDDGHNQPAWIRYFLRMA